MKTAKVKEVKKNDENKGKRKKNKDIQEYIGK